MAGSKSAIRIEMMAITNKSSSRVKARSPRESVRRSVGVVIDRLSIGAMTQPLVDGLVNGLLDKPHRAVAEGEVGSPARMPAPEAADEERRDASLRCVD